MKTLILLTGLIFLILGSSKAQPNIGLYLGLNNASISGDTPDNGKYSGKQGGAFGVNIDFKITNEVLLSFQPGFNTSNVSLSYLDDSTNIYQDSIDINFKAASLPVVINVITDNKKWYFSSGIDFAKIISSTAANIDNGAKSDINTSNYNISINFGVTYLIHLGNPFITIGARYSQGLTNLTNTTVPDSFTPRIKASGIQLRLGIQYPLNKKDE